MSDVDRLIALLRRIDGRPYPAWRDLVGSWDLGGVALIVDHVQADPFAAPSRMRLRVASGVPDAWLEDVDRRVAAEDGLLRRFAGALDPHRRGSGRSGVIEVLRPGSEVVERSALRLLADGTAEVRVGVGLPAAGRRVLGREGQALLLDDLVAAAAQATAWPGLQAHVDSVVTQRALRRALRPAGLVAFVADGAVLPRASGVSEAPLEGAVPFRSPPTLSVTLATPAGPIAGMGVPRGVTVITGGGFHGKSTLLGALAGGHLDRVPGDGRERVVADPDTVCVRAEDGRSVCGVDISPFLGRLPGGRDTSAFHTADASGSTSQAAALVEAAASGARCVLLDEDTSATNLLVRDARMQALITAEPITPLVARVRQLVEVWDLSTVIVVGGVGDWLAVADHVLLMQDWTCAEVTARAHALAGAAPAPPGPLSPVRSRVVTSDGLDAGKVRARDARAVALDGVELDLTRVAGVLGAAGARTLGLVLAWMARHGLLDGHRDLRRALDAWEAIVDDEGIEVVGPWAAPDGGLVRPRRHEVAAALSRVRGLRVHATDDDAPGPSRKRRSPA